MLCYSLYGIGYAADLITRSVYNWALYIDCRYFPPDLPLSLQPQSNTAFDQYHMSLYCLVTEAQEQLALSVKWLDVEPRALDNFPCASRTAHGICLRYN